MAAHHRDLAAAVDGHALADDVDVVAEEVAFRLDWLDAGTARAWVAVDAPGGEESGGWGGLVEVDAGIVEVEGTLAGFVTTDVDEAPSVFDRSDRLIVGDVYVREQYRGTGLARDLMDRAAERAEEVECPELALDVDVDNERAVALYEKLGLGTHRRRMGVDVDDL